MQMGRNKARIQLTVGVAVLVLISAAFGPTTALAQVITKGRVIVDRPKSTAPGTNCKVVNVRIVQSDGTATMQPRRVCQ